MKKDERVCKLFTSPKILFELSFDKLIEAILFCSGRWSCPCFPLHFYKNPSNVLDQYIIIYGEIFEKTLMGILRVCTDIYI